MIALPVQLMPSHTQAAGTARAASVAKFVLQLATCKHDHAVTSTGASDLYPGFVLP